MDKLENNFNLEQKMPKALPRTFVSNVFLWMFAALGITAFVAYIFGTNPSLLSTLITVTPTGESKINILGWISIFAPFIIVLVMTMRVNKMSLSSMVLLYVLYSVLMGLSLSFIFVIYTQASIFKTFIITSAMFGTMAIVGYTTKTDLTKLGSFLLMALIGIIIATLINMFTRSSQLDFIISIIGVIIFTGLTAYDVQKIKRIGESGMLEGDMMAKITIHAALSLYLDFINLFLYLLRFFGNSRD